MSVEAEEIPGWIQQVVEQVEPKLSFFAVGQLDIRWGDEGEIVIAPAVFQVESDDEQNGETGFGAFEVPDVLELASLLKSEQGGPGVVSCGPSEEGSVVTLVIEGQFEGRNVWLEVQFEPFEDAEPTFILELRDEEHPESPENASHDGPNAPA